MRGTLLMALVVAALGCGSSGAAPVAPSRVEAPPAPPREIATTAAEPPPPPPPIEIPPPRAEDPKPAPESASVVAPEPPISQAVLAQMRARFRGCWVKALRTEPALKAAVKLAIDFDAAGRVAKVRVDGVSSSTLQACLEAAVRSSLSLRSGPATIQIPINIDMQGE